MAWELKEEWIDLALSRHVVVFHNPDVLIVGDDGKLAPVEHHLHNEFKLKACPHCGHAKHDADGEPIDFHKVKSDVHEALKAHHTDSMRYREKHPRVRIGRGPQR